MSDTLPTKMAFWLASEHDTEALGRALGNAMVWPCVIHLEGDLGAGKTTFSRGALRALGHKGSVKSPTYTLLEIYELAAGTLCHCDLYRLAHPEELDYLGLRDYIALGSVFLIEWPQRGGALVPAPDLSVHLVAEGEGRRAIIHVFTSVGAAMLAKIHFSDSAEIA